MSVISALRLDRWQDEDDPTRTWRQRLLTREEYITQEGSARWETDYKRNPHYSAGTVVTWFHWGFGVEVDVEPWYGFWGDYRQETTVDLLVRFGPLTVWATRRYAPNRPNVFEPWTSRTATPSPSASSSESSSSSGG